MGWFKKKATKKPTQRVVVIKSGALDSAAPSVETAAYWSYASNASADEIANAEARKVLRARCRYEYLNDSYAMNAARNLAIAVTGTGPRLQLHIDRTIAEPIEKAFQHWAKAAWLNEKLDLAVRSLVFDGEIFFRFVQDNRIPEGFNVELVDAGRVTSETFGLALDENELDGVRYDRYGNPKTYTIARQPVNPIYTGIPVEFETVSADEVLHLFIPDLPGQHRGLPLLQSSLSQLAALRRYTASVLEAAETAANHAALIHTEHLPANEPPADWDAMDEISVPRRSGVVLPRGWVVTQLKPEQPTAQHADFVSATLTGIGAGVGQPRNIISNDSSDYNYASGRLDHQTFFRYVETIQQRLTYILDEVFDYFIETNSDIDNSSFEREWYFAEMQHVDPLKEADASIKLLNARLLTRKEYFAKYGQDSEQQAAQMRKEDVLFPPPFDQETIA